MSAMTMLKHKQDLNTLKGRSFVTITIVIAVVALLLRTGIEQLIKINITQNESNALITLKSISTALENYSKNNIGVFPVSLSVLTQTQPAYLDKDYISLSPLKGYTYSFERLEPYSYSCKATPTSCNVTGKTMYSITTNGILISEECGKKEKE